MDGASQATMATLKADRPRMIRFVLVTLGVLVLWTAVVGIGLLEGWGRSPLAPRGDTQAFMNALVREVETARAGNVALALIEDGSVDAGP